MAMSDPAIVVCGATGNQGGAVLDALLAKGGLRLKALTRNPERAQKWLTRGVEVVQGDLTDRGSLERAFHGATAVFGVTQPWSADYRKADTKAEIAQGRSLTEACLATGATLVFSTVLLENDKPTGIPHVDSKLELEQFVKERGVPAVILGPASFMDNIGMDFFPVRNGKVRGFVDGDAKVPLVSCRDIGRSVAGVMAALPAHLGKRHNLIAGLYSGEDICATLSRLRGGERFRYTAPPKLVMRLFVNEFYRMRVAFEQMGRPPLPPMFDEALRETAALVGTPVSLEAFLRDKGFAER